MGLPINTNLRMSMQEYLRTPALSSSALAMADTSMAKYLAYKHGQVRFESKALDLGTAVHAMIEDSESWHELYTIKPEGMDYRTKEGKAFKEENQWKNIIDRETAATVFGCYEAWKSSPDRLIRIARESQGEAEISRFWDSDGILCKVRADRLITVSGEDNEWLAEEWPSLFNPISNTIAIDYKTTSRGADYWSFDRTAKALKYKLKAAHYLAGFKADAFLWIVIETCPPYHITRFLLSAEKWEFYEARRMELISKIRECEGKNEWPGLTISKEETLL